MIESALPNIVRFPRGFPLDNGTIEERSHGIPNSAVESHTICLGGLASRPFVRYMRGCKYTFTSLRYKIAASCTYRDTDGLIAGRRKVWMYTRILGLCFRFGSDSSPADDFRALHRDLVGAWSAHRHEEPTQCSKMGILLKTYDQPLSTSNRMIRKYTFAHSFQISELFHPFRISTLVYPFQTSFKYQ